MMKRTLSLLVIFISVFYAMAQEKVNPVRKSSTFQRGGSHGALNPVFALKGIISSFPLQAAGLSNGVKKHIEEGVEVIVNPIKPCPIKGEPTALHLEKEFTIDITRDDLKRTGLKDIWIFDIDSENNIYLTGSPPDATSIFKFDKKGNYVKKFGKERFIFQITFRLFNISLVMMRGGFL